LRTTARASAPRKVVIGIGAYDSPRAMLRDLYACAALQGLLSRREPGTASDDRYTAARAFAIAEAMLRERTERAQRNPPR
jgi:hypothetical protein